MPNGGGSPTPADDPIVNDPTGRIPPWAYSVPSYKPPEAAQVHSVRYFHHLVCIIGL
jgi:hypothetical protein